MADSSGTSAANSGPAGQGGGGNIGLGCFATAAGGAGGYMIGVLIAKIVGAIRGCPSDAETGAPCNFFVFGVAGIFIGAVLLPTVVLTLRRRSRRRFNDSKRG